MKSDLAYEDLAAIWNIADSTVRGALDFQEFALGMYLIESLKECRLSSVPSSIPPHITEQLANVSLVEPKFRSPLVSSDGRMSSPFYNPSLRPSPRTPSKFSPTLPPTKDNGRTVTWDVSQSEKLESDKHFMILDSDGTGFVEEDDAVKFLMRYKLSFSVLVQILSLADIRNDNKLTCDEFAVVMHLIKKKLAGNELPEELPPSLIPPMMRPLSLPKTPQPSQLPTMTLKGKETTPPEPAYGAKHRLSRSSTGAPPRELPTVSNRSRQTSIASIPLTFLTNSPKVRPPIAVKPPNLSVSTSPPPTSPPPTSPPITSPFIASPPIAINEPLEELRTETKQLRLQVETLLKQLASQTDRREDNGRLVLENSSLQSQTLELRLQVETLSKRLASQADHREDNERLVQENSLLESQMREVESNMSQVLMASEQGLVSEEISEEMQRLSSRVNELEHTELKLSQTTQMLTELRQANLSLIAQLRDSQAAEQSVKDNIMDLQKTLASKEQDNADLQARISDMGEAMSGSSSPGTSSRELQVLLRDVTRENERLKERVREMERSMEQLLLSSRNHARHDEMTRENRRLREQVQDLEMVTAQMQASTDQTQLQRVIDGMTREIDELKTRMMEMQSSYSQHRTAIEHRLAQSQRQLEQLTQENEQLKSAAQATAASRARSPEQEDNSVPPPAYDDTYVEP